MSQAKTFSCPSCGAALSAQGTSAEIKCQYCGNTVIVPEELRDKPAQNVFIQLPEPIVQLQQPIVRSAPVTIVQTSSSGCSCSSIFGILVTLIILGAIALGVLAGVDPQLVDRLIAQAPIGYARQDLTFGGEGTGPGLFQDARHVAVDGNGNVYISDYNTLRIQKFDSTGKYVSGWVIGDEGGTPKSKYGPSQLAVDNAGNVYVLLNSSAVLKYDGASGKFLTRYTGEVVNKTANLYDRIQKIAVSPNSLLAISDAQFSDDLLWMDSTGKVTNRVKKIVSGPIDEDYTVASQLSPAVDGLGNIFILYETPSVANILKYSPTGKYVNRFGSKGDKPGQLRGIAQYIAVDNQSRVYVSDFNGIEVFDANGQYLANIAGSVYGGGILDFAISQKNELYVVGSQSTIHKLVLNEIK